MKARRQSTLTRLGAYGAYLLVFVSLFAYGQGEIISEGVLQEQQRLIQQEQLRREEQQRKRDESRYNNPAIDASGADDSSREKQQQSTDRQCYLIKTITIEGITQIPPEKVEQLRSRYQGKCLNFDDINSILTVINSFYIEKGFITSRGYIPPQNLSLENLTIKVVEGNIVEIHSDEGTLSTRQLNQAFPKSNAELLNLRDLEQGIDQINRMSTHNASMELIPGEEVGSSVVSIRDKTSPAWRLLFNIDNSLEDQQGLNLTVDNPLSFLGIFSLNAVADLSSLDSELGNKNISGHYDIPLGYWNIDLDSSWFRYGNVIEGSQTTFLSSGSNFNHSLRISKLLKRSQTYKMGSRLAIRYRESENFIEDVLVETTSRALTSGSIEFWAERYFKGGQLTGSFTFQRGLPWFGAVETRSSNSGEPIAIFNKYRLRSNYYKRFSSGRISGTYNISLTAQHSPETLFSSEQISIGGQYTVRGYDLQRISGNSGAYLRTDISVDVINKPANWFGRIFGDWKATIGYDFGVVRDAQREFIPERDAFGRLHGIGFGLRSQRGLMNLSVEYARAINAPPGIEYRDSELYFSIGLVTDLLDGFRRMRRTASKEPESLIPSTVSHSELEATAAKE